MTQITKTLDQMFLQEFGTTKPTLEPHPNYRKFEDYEPYDAGDEEPAPIEYEYDGCNYFSRD